jgi:hypothetical protein
VTKQEFTQVMPCCNLLAPVHQLSFNSRRARMSFSQVQRVFIVEHYLASHSYFTCQNEFRDTFPESPVPNKLTISCLVNRLSTVDVQGCLFHKCNECSLLNTTWHLILTSLARMSLGIHFQILLCRKN